MPKVEINVGSQTYDGKTQKEATGKALEHLAALFPPKENDGWAPIVVGPVPEDGDPTKPMVGVAFKDGNGFWSYRIHRTGGTGCITSSAWSKGEAEKKMRRHMAQNAFKVGDKSSLEVIRPDDLEGLNDHKRWMEFQIHFSELRAEGKTGEEAHRLAGKSAL